MVIGVKQMSPGRSILIDKLLRVPLLFCSQRFVVLLLGLTLAVCLLGVLVPQRGSASHTQWASDHPVIAHLAATAGFDDTFRSRPFLALMLVAGLSVAVFVLSRLGRLLPRGSGRGLVADLLARRRLYGSLLFHAGLLGVLAAGALSALTRSEGRVVLTEGQVVELDAILGLLPRSSGEEPGNTSSVGLRLDKFHPIHQGRWGTPDYTSEVTVLEKGREVQKVAVRVNQPLKHRGTTFLQRLHGFSPLFVLTDPQGRRQFGSWVALDTNLEVEPVRYYDDFAIPGTSLTVEAELFPDAFMEGTRLASRSPQLENPALDLTVRDGIETLYSGTVYLGETIELPRGFRLAFGGVRYWSGFDTVRDRGVGLLFTSAWIVVLGLCVRFVPLQKAHG